VSDSFHTKYISVSLVPAVILIIAHTDDAIFFSKVSFNYIFFFVFNVVEEATIGFFNQKFNSIC
jgi:hypothetical protein